LEKHFIPIFVDVEETFWERTNRLIKECGLTQEALTQKCKFNDPRRITNLSSRGSMPKCEELLLIARNLRASTDYLLTGKDALDDGERNLLKAYNQLNDMGKEFVINTVKGLVSTYPQQPAQVGESTGMVT